MENRSVISWDKPMRERFRKAYKKHINEEKFEFEGHEYLVHYAKYLIEYLDMRLK